MKNIYAPQMLALAFCCLLSLFSSNAFAQVGIGTTTPDANALLDVDASTTPGGLLLPRLALTATNSPLPLSNPVLAGMAVYNTATAGTSPNDVTPGYYYHDGTQWVRIAADAPSDDWSRGGNIGTVPGTNFLGTIDDIPLRFRTFNGDRFEISNGDVNNSGRLRGFENGSAAQPTYSWTGNIGTGMFQQAADVISFTTGSTERFRIANGAQVHAIGNGTAVLPFYSWASNVGTGMFQQAANVIGFSTGGNERLRITNGAQVQAIGNGTAAAPFYSWASNVGTGMFQQAANVLGFSTNAIERMRLSTTESVFNDVSNNYDFRIESDGQDDMFFVDASTNRIGINTLTPTNVIDFRTTGENIWLTHWENNSASNGASGQFIHTNASNGNRVLMGASNYTGSAFVASGVIGLALGTSGSGGEGVTGFSNSNDAIGTYGGFVGGTNPFVAGWALYADGWAGGLTFWQNVSDKKLKRNIKTLDGSLAKVLQLRGVEYYYDKTNYPDVNLDTDSKQIGFVAQEVESIFPNLVRDSNIFSSPRNEDGSLNETRNTYKVKSLSYTNLIPVLVEAIKEQEKIIDSQEKRIQNLELLVHQLIKQ